MLWLREKYLLYTVFHKHNLQKIETKLFMTSWKTLEKLYFSQKQVITRYFERHFPGVLWAFDGISTAGAHFFRPPRTWWFYSTTCAGTSCVKNFIASCNSLIFKYLWFCDKTYIYLRIYIYACRKTCPKTKLQIALRQGRGEEKGLWDCPFSLPSPFGLSLAPSLKTEQ